MQSNKDWPVTNKKIKLYLTVKLRLKSKLNRAKKKGHVSN